MNNFAKYLCLLVLAITLQACSGPGALAQDETFRHDQPVAAVPWTDADFDAADDKFMFAVFSDLTGGERAGIFEIAVAQLNLLRPELIINVGDLIEGSTAERAVADAQWDSFDERARRARAPVFYVGGNHDLTGEFLRGVWSERLGRNYYHFVYKNVLFLVLDTEDNTPERMRKILAARTEAVRVYAEEGQAAFAKTEYASLPELPAGNITEQQAAYFLAAIEANQDVRWTFLFMHKAPWLREDLKAFADIESALAGRPYTVFHGHEHAYAYLERNGRDYIQLATTGGVQVGNKGRSMDQVTLVTVSDSGADIANLLLEGILDKTGHIPLDGDEVCFESAKCAAAGRAARNAVNNNH
jgi:predicted phosphodiesterase